MNGVLDNLRRELQPILPPDLFALLEATDGGLILARELPERFSPWDVIKPAPNNYRMWEATGLYLLASNKPMDARAILWGLYDHIFRYEKESGSRQSGRATPLIWIAHCHQSLGHAAHVQRYLMLALCDDAIASGGRIRLRSTGVLERVRNYGLMTDDVAQHYAQMALEIYSNSNPTDRHYPEWILFKIQERDDRWMTAVPAPAEAYVYLPNLRFLGHLMKDLGSDAGKSLEVLAAYILSVMPGCRITRRKRTWSAELDIVCSIDGIESEFRSEFGRYFVCECKDRTDPASFTDVAKFCRVLEGMKSRFGIMFSRKGITGQGKRQFAELEIMNLFKETGIVVVVIDQQDLDAVLRGESFISRVRTKYERTRLTLQSPKKADMPKSSLASGQKSPSEASDPPA